MTTEKRIFSGVLVGLVSFVLGFIQAILLVPILLTFWGNETYGIWIVLNAGYIILQTLDSGQQSFIGNELNLKFFSNRNELQTVLASSLRMASLIGILQLIFVFLLILSNSTHLFLGLSLIVVEKEYLNICLILLVISWISSGTYTSILNKLMIPYGFYSKSIWWSIYNKIGNFIILVIIAMNNGSILDATIGISLFTIIFNSLLLYRIRLLIPDVYPWWKNANWKTGFTNLKRSSWISATGILSQLSNNGLVILITYLFGAITVPIFTTLRTLTNSATQITNTIIQPLQPELVKFNVKKDFLRILETFDLNWIISGFLINVGILIVLPFLPDLYYMWTRGKIDFDLNLFLVLALAVSIYNFGSVLVFYLHSLNRVTQQFTLTAVKLSIIFLISILLSKVIGLLAVGIGIALSELIGYLILPYWYSRKDFFINSARYNFKTMFIRTLPNLILLLVFSCIFIFSKNILEFSIVGILVLLFIYLRMWKKLSKEIRQRILLIINLKSFF